MYLNKLNAEQKELFLNLGVFLTNADGVLNNEEEYIISQMCQEMSIEKKINNDLGVEDIIEKLSLLSTEIEKKMIFIELVAIVMTDGLCNEDEMFFIKKIATKFNISNNEIEQTIKNVSDLYHIYSNLNEFINKVV